MEYVKVAELSLPAVGLGTLRLKGDDCVRVVSAAIGMGYRHLDTARKYGNEEEVGQGIRRSGVDRGDVIVTTKLDHHELTPDVVGPAVDSSLRRLGTDYVDILLIHWPNAEVPLAGTLEAMEDARQQGKARFIGVANFPVRLMEQVIDTPFLIGNQVEYHPYLSQARALQIVRDNGLVLTAFCPLGRGGLLDDPVLTEIALDHGRSVAQIALRWLVEQDRVITIPGSSNSAHVAENLRIFDFRLDAAAVAAIADLARDQRVVNPPHAPRWDGPELPT